MESIWINGRSIWKWWHFVLVIIIMVGYSIASMAEEEILVYQQWKNDAVEMMNQEFVFPNEITETLMRYIMKCDEKDKITYFDVHNVRSFEINNRSPEEVEKYLSVLKYFPNLDTVDIQNCGLKEIPYELSKIPITSLYLDGNDLRDISALKDMKRLNVLQLYANNFIEDYSPLAGLSDLKYLSVSMFFNQDLSAIENCKKLKQLSINGSFLRVVNGCSYDGGPYCVPLNNIAFLDELPALEKVSFYHFSELSEEAIDQIENSEIDAEIEIHIYDGEIRNLFDDLTKGINGAWLGEGMLRGLSKEDILSYYRTKE